MNIAEAMVEANDRYPVRREAWPVRKYVILNIEPNCNAEIWYYDPLNGDKGPYKPTPFDLLADDWELA